MTYWKSCTLSLIIGFSRSWGRTVPLASASNCCIDLSMCVHSKGKYKTASLNLRMLRALFYEAASRHQPRSYSSTMRSLKTLIRPSIFYLLITWSSSGLELSKLYRSFCSVESRSFHSIKTVGSNTEFSLKGNENGIKVSRFGDMSLANFSALNCGFHQQQM